MKQSKLRKRRVWRYAVLYFVLLILFLALLIGPIVAGSRLLSPSLTDKNPLYLFQPVGLNNNDTQNYNQTGTGAPGYGASTTSVASATAKIKLF
jgi:1,3-beta-glucan synthase